MANNEIDKHSLENSEITQFLFAHNPSGVVLLKPTGEILRANSQFGDMILYKNSDLVGLAFKKMIHPEDLPRFRSLLEKPIDQPSSSTPEILEGRLKKRDGSWLYVKCSIGHVLTKGGSPCLIGIIENQTEIRTLQEQLDNSLANLFHIKERLEKMEFSLENTRIGVTWADRESRVAFTNKAYAEMVGVGKEQLIGMRVIDYRTYFDEESWKKLWEETKEEKHKIIELEFPPTQPEGIAIPVEASINYIEFNGIPYILVFFRDISIRKKHLKKVEQQNREMEQFTYAASHDLQGPLKTIKNYINLLKEELGDNIEEEAHKFLEVVYNSANRMKILTNHLLDFSRLGQKRTKTWVNCEEILKNIQTDLEASISESQTRIEVGPLPEIFGYETELRLLFQNLIINATKFRKKEVTPIIKIGVQEEINHWVFSVADNGIGIKPAHQDRIFGIFQRLHSQKDYEGTGIGLANCRKIAELHDGNIWVESREGEGSTFFIKIPK